jgi:hypothetical protein
MEAVILPETAELLNIFTRSNSFTENTRRLGEII